MSIINFFAHNIKPRKLEGTGMLNPANTSVISENVRCIRQWDVNIWFYTKNGTTIAFDSGYETFPDLEGEFVKIGVDPKLIKTVLITHADMDHAGGISDKGTRIFPNACVYIHENEEDMLLGKEERFVFGPLKIKNPIVYSGRYCCLKDGETIYIEAVSYTHLDVYKRQNLGSTPIFTNSPSKSGKVSYPESKAMVVPFLV